MTTENNAPIAGMPDFDPKADRGSEFVAEGAAKTVELSADELKAIGKAPVEETPVKTPAEKKEDKKDEKEGAKEPVEAKKEGEEEPARNEKGQFIPKARFDEVNNKAKAKVATLEAEKKALEARLGLVDGKLPSTDALEAELVTRSAEYSKQVADGDLDAANATMASINKLNRTIGNIEAAAISGQHSAETQNIQTLGELVDLYKDTYPQFDDANTEHYNQVYVDFVANLQGRFELTGSSPAEALREAVELAVAKFGLDPVPEAVPAAAAAPDKGVARKETAVEKALKAAGGQPPATGKVGENSDATGLSAISIEQLSDFETFDALAKNESTLKRLRGDIA
jgi:hypothetical protein